MRIGFDEPAPCRQFWDATRTHTERHVDGCAGQKVTVTRTYRSYVSQRDANDRALELAKCEAKAALAQILRGETPCVSSGYGYFNNCPQDITTIEGYTDDSFTWEFTGGWSGAIGPRQVWGGFEATAHYFVVYTDPLGNFGTEIFRVELESSYVNPTFPVAVSFTVAGATFTGTITRHSAPSNKVRFTLKRTVG